MDKKLFLGYIGAAISLFLYSYTQVDLSLTLSRLSIYQTIEKSFQYVGYYQRPLSTALFIALVVIFFVLYSVALNVKKLSLWPIIIGITIIFLFSYPAFSYDIFNYMFDAKTVLVYHKLPYAVSPLQFTGVEPWLSFMHWTHIPSIFSPFWILLTIPFYLLGFGYFLGIMWSFKLLVAVAYLTAAWLIYRVLRGLDPDNAARGTAIFALNPLIIFETLLSGHNDIVMMALAVGAFYVYVHKNHLSSFFLLASSVATKVMTVSLIPLFIFGWKRSWAFIAMIIGFVLFIAITKREIQPWYMIWFIPWYALLPRLKWLTIIGTGLCAGFLLRYVPFLYTGGYNPPVPTVMNWLVIVPAAISIIWAFARYGKLQV